MELNRLKYFLSVAEHLNFSAAAEALNMSQPPLSLQIKKLEEEVGAKLFVRTSRSVALTQAGHELLRGARVVAAQAARSVETARAAANGEAGTLSIGLTDDNVHGDIINAISAFHRLSASIRIYSQVGESKTLTGLVEDQSLDVAIVSQASPTGSAPDLRTMALSPLEFVVIVAKDHTFSRETMICLSQLRGEPFIFPPPSTAVSFSAQANIAFDRAGFTPNIVHQTISADVIAHLVARGIGVSLVTKNIATMYAAQVHALTLEDPLFLTRTAIWHAQNHGELLRKFLLELKDS